MDYYYYVSFCKWFFLKIYQIPYYFLFFWILASDSLRSLVTSFLSLRLVFSWNDKQRKGCDQSRTAKYPSEWRYNAGISALTWCRRQYTSHYRFHCFLIPSCDKILLWRILRLLHQIRIRISITFVDSEFMRVGQLISFLRSIYVQIYKGSTFLWF